MFDKNNPYLRNISQLISLISKIESVFFTITAFDKMEYEFKNGVILEVLKKFIIVTINLLIYYLIIEVSYVRSLLIIKLIFISIKKFEFPRKANFTYNYLTKPK